MSPSLLRAGSLFAPWSGRGRRVAQPPCRYETSGRGSSGQRARRLMQCRGPEPAPSLHPASACPGLDGSMSPRPHSG